MVVTEAPAITFCFMSFIPSLKFANSATSNLPSSSFSKLTPMVALNVLPSCSTLELSVHKSRLKVWLFNTGLSSGIVKDTVSNSLNE